MNYFIQFLIVFDLICFGVYFGGDIVCTALAKVRKKTDEEEFEIYKVEDDTDTSKPALSIDAIRGPRFCLQQTSAQRAGNPFRSDRAGADSGPVPVLRLDRLSQRGSPEG